MTFETHYIEIDAEYANVDFCILLHCDITIRATNRRNGLLHSFGVLDQFSEARRRFICMNRGTSTKYSKSQDAQRKGFTTGQQSRDAVET